MSLLRQPLLLVWWTVLILAVALPVTAQTLFVVPSSEIPIRKGMGTEYRIIAMAPDGTEVELIQENEGWSFVRMENGKEGWLPSRFLNDTPPPFQQLDRLTKEKTALEEENSRLQVQLEELTAINSQSAGELTTCITQRDSISSKYKNLREDAANALETKKRLEKTEKQLQQLQATIKTLHQTNNKLQKDQTLRWFLAGSGVLLTGWLLGLLFGRSKRRRSSLL